MDGRIALWLGWLNDASRWGGDGGDGMMHSWDLWMPGWPHGHSGTLIGVYLFGLPAGCPSQPSIIFTMMSFWWFSFKHKLLLYNSVYLNTYMRVYIFFHNCYCNYTL